MGSPRRRLATLLAIPAGVLVVAALALVLRTGEAPPGPPSEPPAKPRIIRAYPGPAEELSVDRLEGLDDRQRAAARRAVEDARRRLDRTR